MAVNSMTFKQESTLLNDLLEQMTGQSSIAPKNESEFAIIV